MTRAAFAAALLLLATAAAQAHTVIPGIGGFPGGLLHPLLVPAHTLTLIALGLLAGTFAARTQALLLAAFAGAAIAAFGLIAMAYSAAQAETLILCLGAAIGLLLAANLVPPALAATVLTAAIAGAVIFDSVPPVLTVSETALALTGTVVSAGALVAATAFISGALPPRIRQIGLRIAGSWIAASAVMVLALRLAVVG
jgi:urease accessory protein